MINEQLLGYVKQQLSQGVGRETITRNLKSQGWTDADVAEAFNAINPVVAPASTATPTPTPVATPVSPVASSPMQTQAQTAQTTQPTNFTPPSHKSRKSLLIVSILVLVGLAGAGAYAYYSYQRGQITVGQAIVNTIDGIKNSEIKSAEFSARADVKFGKSDDALGNTNDVVSSLPGVEGTTVSMSLNGIFDATVKDDFKTYGKINLSVELPASEDSELALLLGKGALDIELEYYVFADSAYFRLNKIPSIISNYADMLSAQGINLSDYMNTWFVVNETEMDLFKLGFMKGFTESAKEDGYDLGDDSFNFTLSDENYQKLKEIIVKYYDLSGALSVTDRKSETLSGDDRVTVLYLAFNKDKYISATKESLNELTPILLDIFPNMDFNEEGIKDLFDNQKEVYDVMDMSNLKFFVGRDGYYHGQQGSFGIKSQGLIPSISEDIYFNVKNYNKSFNLEKPKDAKNLMTEVTKLKSQEEEKVQKSSTKKK